MDGPRPVLELVRDRNLAVGRLRGFFHLLIGRTLSRDGTVLSTGASWRELAHWLKLLKFDRELVRELEADPDTLSPKDREKFWYAAIAMAKVDSPQARREADELAGLLVPLGFIVSGLPIASKTIPAEPKSAPIEVAEESPAPVPPPPAKRKKK